MSSHVVYSCRCLNIRIHLSTKYTNEKLDELKTESIVQEPVPGWEFELGMGGIVIELNSLIQSTIVKSGWKTTTCLNCNCGNMYSLADQNTSSVSGHVVIHENAICGKEVDEIKNNVNYSQIFNIKLNDNNEENLIPMPSLEEDIPDKLVSAHKQIQSILDHSVEKIRIESKLRIEEFKKQEEKKTQELISHAKLENNQLWSKIIQVSKEKEEHHADEKKEKSSHVRFAPVVDDQEPPRPSVRKLSFALDEAAISGSLKNKDLDHYGLKLQREEQSLDDDEEEEEEMFNLDEEFSDDDKEEVQQEEGAEEEKDDSVDKEEDTVSDDKVKNKDQLLSSSLKKSISEIDQKFSWIKKKRNTSKYLAQDFDLRTDFKRDSKNDEDKAVSIFAISVPITIHYPAAEEENNDNDSNEGTPKKKDILASSFANYDFSYSDRMLSEQFPAPRRRKSLASSSLIRPQLESLVGKSLDTRGLMKKKANEIEPKDYDDEDGFDSSLPPHVWAQMESIKDEYEDEE